MKKLAPCLKNLCLKTDMCLLMCDALGRVHDLVVLLPEMVNMNLITSKQPDKPSLWKLSQDCC